MSWMDALLSAVNEAIATDGEACTITVPTEAQKGLGEKAVGRMSPGSSNITFVVDITVEKAAMSKS